MENIVKNVYTAYRINNMMGDDNYISIKDVKFSDKKFGFDIWFYMDGSSNILISQDGGFSLGIVQNRVVLRIPGHNTLTIRSDIHKIPERKWMNLYMGFDGSQISVFINGNLYGEAAFSGNLRDDNAFLLGKEFTGYIRSLRFYSSVLDEKEYRRYFMQTEYKADSMLELVAFIDMTQRNMPDLSGKGASASIHAGCTFMDLVDIYSPKSGGVVSFSNSEGINPGGFSSGKFSIYAKIYLRPSQAGRQLLYINGRPDSDDSVAVYCDKTGNMTTFALKYGKEEICFDSKEPDYSWVDVIVCADGKNISAYINGTAYNKMAKEALVRSAEGDFRIGGHQKASGMICENYIHTVAIFEKVFTEKDAEDFMNNHPFILEDDLVALVSFEGGDAAELADGIEITAGQDGLFPVQRTVEKIPSEPYQFRVNYTKEAASEMKQWQAEQIVNTYMDLGKTMMGCASYASARTVAALTRYISNHEKILQEAWALYSKAKIKESDVSTALSKVSKASAKALTKASQFSAGASAAAGAGAAIGESAFMMFIKEYGAVLAIGGAIAVIGATLIIQNVNEKHKEKPDDEDDEDDDKDDISVKLLAITFQHTPDQCAVSAVRCRNYEGTVVGPEWTSEKKCVAPALYIADRLGKIKIKIKYRITDNSKKKAGVYSVSLGASVFEGEQALFNNFKYNAVAKKEGVDYEVEMESDIKASVQNDIQFTKIKLWWDCSVNEKHLSMPSTESEIYIIPQVPTTSIFLDKGCDYFFPAIEYLKIYTQILKPQKWETKKTNGAVFSRFRKVTTEQIRQLTQLIYYAPCFRYQGEPKYEYTVTQRERDVFKLNFYEKNFFKDVEDYCRGRRRPLEIGCEVYASVLGYYLQLLNVQYRIVMIYNPDRGGPIKTNPVYASGHMDEAPEEYVFSFHVVVEVAARSEQGNQIPASIYDASLGMEQGGVVKPIMGLPFQRDEGPMVNAATEAGTYRAVVFNDRTNAALSDQCIRLSVKKS